VFLKLIDLSKPAAIGVPRPAQLASVANVASVVAAVGDVGALVLVGVAHAHVQRELLREVERPVRVDAVLWVYTRALRIAEGQVEEVVEHLARRRSPFEGIDSPITPCARPPAS
jgi:hypothetical protein